LDQLQFLGAFDQVLVIDPEDDLRRAAAADLRRGLWSTIGGPRSRTAAQRSHHVQFVERGFVEPGP
jgi:hypothetical protein